MGILQILLYCAAFIGLAIGIVVFADYLMEKGDKK